MGKLLLVTLILLTGCMDANQTVSKAEAISNTIASTTLVNFSTSAQTVSEGAGNTTVTVTINNAQTTATAVNYTVTGTSTSGTDFTALAGTVTIPAGSTSAAFTVTLTDDALDEDTETIVLSLDNSASFTIGSVSSQTISITDNDAVPTVTFSAAAQAVAENIGAVTITVNVSTASGRDIYIPYTVSGTATSNYSDHDLLNGTLHIPAGVIVDNSTINIVSDALYENNETVIITMGVPTNATLGATTTQTITITDDDAIPTVTFTAGAQAVTEGNRVVTGALTLSAASGLYCSVSYTVAGTSSTGLDHNLADGTVLISPGNTTGAISFNLYHDTLYEDNETIIITFSAYSACAAGATTAHTVTITNDDSAPIVIFSASSQSIYENSASGTVTVYLSSISGLDVTIPYVVGGTATTAVDYAALAGTLTILAGSSSGTITLTPTDDVLDEDNETVILTMGALTNGTAGTTTVHTLTLVDNDVSPTATFTAASQTVAENVGAVTITAQLSALSGRDVTIPYTVSGSASGGAVDHDLASGSLTILAGALSNTITINITDDAIYEGTEGVVVTMGSLTNATSGTYLSHTVYVTDNEAGITVNFTAAAQAVAENVGTATLTAQLSAVHTANVIVPITVSATSTATGTNTDYSLGCTSITILAGAMTGSCTINITSDTMDENNETVVITMGTPVNATAGATTTHTLTINDDDAQPNVNFSTAAQSVNEYVASTNAYVTVSLDAVSGLDVTVPYSINGGSTATAASDYSTPGALQVVIPRGTLTATFSIPIINDTTDEVSETIIIDMGAPSNAAAGATIQQIITLVDNDVNINFSAATQTVAESVGTVTVTAQYYDGGMLAVNSTGYSVTVPFTVTGTSLGSGVDHNLSAGNITIANGANSGTTTFTVVNDTLNENDETVIVTMGTPTFSTTPSNTQIAVGTITTHTVTISYNDAVTSFALGLGHSCALVGGVLKCWGRNDKGQLGIEATTMIGDGSSEMGSYLATTNLGTGRTATVVSAGLMFTCAVLDNSQVKCWGDNSEGQLGQGSTTNLGDGSSEMGDSLPAISLTTFSATSVAAGSYHACALSTAGGVRCWGNNQFGQLGIDSTNTQGDAAGEVAALTDITLGQTATAIATGAHHSCALLSDGDMRCWGLNNYGQLGDNSTLNKGDEAAEMAAIVDIDFASNITAITAGDFHTCALLATGDVKCWGYNADGQLGQDSTTNLTNATAVANISLGGATTYAISAKGDTTCVLLNSATVGDVRCFGQNDYGQLGQEDVVNYGTATNTMATLSNIDLGTGITASNVSVGSTHTCAIVTNSMPKCFGRNNTGQLGLGSTSTIGDQGGEMGDDLGTPSL